MLCSWVALAFVAAFGLQASPHGQARRPHVLPMEPRWTVELANEPASPPVTDGVRVIVPLHDGSIVALNRADGAEIWTAKVDTRLPLVWDQGLLFAASGQEVRALRAADGSMAWRAPIGEIQTPLTSVAGWLIAGTKAGDIVALRALDGSEIWRRPIAGALAAAPAVEGDRIYVPFESGRVAAWQIERGEPVWQRTLGGRPGGVLALPDRIFLGASDNFLYCLARSDGEILWRWRTAADVVGLPSADDRRVYFVSLDNVVRALDRRTGVQRWKQLLPARHLGGPQVAGGIVMAAMPTVQLLFFLADTGRPAASLDLASPLAAGAAALETTGEGGYLFVTTVDSTGVARLVAFGPASRPALAPLRDMPGIALWPEVPLATKPLPVGLLVLPEPPRRIW